MRKFGTFLVIFVLALAGGVVGAVGYDQVKGDDGGKTVVQQAPLSAAPSNADGQAGGDGTALTPAEIYAKAAPGVVLIQAIVTETTQGVFGEQQQQGVSTGTGFVVSDDGYIVTNAHVVEGAKTATVQFGEDKQINAEIKGIDVNHDLAVLKIDPKAHALQPLKLGSTKGLKVGDPVAAIGNPYGLDRTLTTGVVSALARRIDGLNGFKINNVIQTDAAINKGNSGGPLIDAAGEVIGVNSQIQTENGGNVGIGFAIPVERVKSVIPTLEKGGTVQVAYLGVTAQQIDDKIASAIKISKGLLVASVDPKSGAAKAGLKAGDSGAYVQIGDGQVDLGGDVILSVDGKELDTPQQLQDYIGDKNVGDVVTLLIERGTKKMKLKVTLTNRPTAVTSTNDQQQSPDQQP
ncbi:MAG: trypsin-like peptidase domain-containing protein [Solirubrobacteraceae bacterium]|nr:trypsin-like peptidase domain-containing protein [Patulibacter sp.]